MKSVIRPAARDDIVRIFRWYLLEQDAPDAAFRFVDAVEESVRKLLLMPEMGLLRENRNPSLRGLRVWPVKKFEEFLIFYLVRDDTIRIVRVLHGKRDVQRVLRNESDEADTSH